MLFCIVVLAINVFHTTPHCMYSGYGVSQTGCDASIVDNCTPALFVYSKDVGGTGVKAFIICPWSMQSYITGYVGPALTILLVVLIVAVRRDSYPRNLFFALAGLAITALIASVACMIHDIVKAFDEYNKESEGSGFSMMPATYIVNAVVNLILAFLIVWTAKKAKGDGSTPGYSRSVQAWDQPPSYQPSYHQPSHQQSGFPSRR